MPRTADVLSYPVFDRLVIFVVILRVQSVWEGLSICTGCLGSCRELRVCPRDLPSEQTHSLRNMSLHLVHPQVHLYINTLRIREESGIEVWGLA